MGEILPTFVTSATTRERKLALDPSMRSLNDDVIRCKEIDASRAAAWAGFYRSWRLFFDAPDAFWSAASEVDAADLFRRQFVTWQAYVKQTCTTSQPDLVDRRDPASLDLQETIRTVAIAAAVIAAIAAAYVAAKEARIL